jgi:glycerophosphoryl diester phosphodiesterase
MTRLEDMTLPLIIAHRGDSSHAIENSPEAVRRALFVPADMIEVDIRKSRDNVLYIMHDEDTGRTCDRSISIERSLSEEIGAVRLRNGEQVPTLNDVLDIVAGVAALNLEIKSEGAGALAAAHIIGSGYQGEIVMSSFKEREIDDARRVLPDMLAGGIFDHFSVRDLTAYRSKGYRLVSLKRKTVTSDLVDACHERKIKIFVWTVDEADEMRKFVEWGVDGIYTNKPAEMRQIINSV